MYDKDFAELVKIAAEKLKEDTVYKMLIHSNWYIEKPVWMCYNLRY